MSPVCSKPKVLLEPTLLREEREGKVRRQKAILPTSQPAELNTTLTSARFFHQSPGPCLTPCSVNRSLVDLIGPRTRESPTREECWVPWRFMNSSSSAGLATIPEVSVGNLALLWGAATLVGGMVQLILGGLHS